MRFEPVFNYWQKSFLSHFSEKVAGPIWKYLPPLETTTDFSVNWYHRKPDVNDDYFCCLIFPHNVSYKFPHTINLTSKQRQNK